MEAASEQETHTPVGQGGLARGRPLRKLLVYVVVFLGAIAMGWVATFLSERTTSSQRVTHGVWAFGRPLAGLDAASLERIIASQNRRLAALSVELVWQQERTHATLEQLGVAYDVAGVTREILELGRGSGMSSFAFWVQRLFSTWELRPSASVNRAQLRGALEPWLKEHMEEPRAPSVSFQGRLLVDTGHAGWMVEWDELERRLVTCADELMPAVLTMPARLEQAIVAPALMEERVEQARRLFAGPLLFELEPGAMSAENEQKSRDSLPEERRSWSLSPAQLGEAFSSVVPDGSDDLKLVLSPEVLGKALGPSLEGVERQARDATFEISSAAQVKVVPSLSGLVLDKGELVLRVWRAVEAQRRRVMIPLRVIPPLLSTEQAEGLGIRGLVSSFTTHHKCCQPRVHNIHIAAARVDGVVLRPGERFSLNERLGPRLASVGYRLAPTIVRGKMEKVLGGGISQLATTLFNAALRGGYAIVQRQPHSIYFPRYPEGHEATVSYPEPDLIFQNDTSSGVLVKAHYTDTFIKIMLYGDNEDRRVRVQKSSRYDILKPPTEYEPDERMEPGEVRRLRAGQLGWTVLVSREITYLDGTNKTEKREVKYSPYAELLRVHPCQIPKGHPGHTGEECPEITLEEREEELSDDVYYETTTQYEVVD